MENILLEFQTEIRALSSAEGCNQTEIPFLTAYRFTTGQIRMPQTENLYLYLVLDGTLRLYTPSGIMDYVPGQYSISRIDTPLSGTIVTFSEQHDLLAVAFEFTANDVINSVLDLDNNLLERITSEKLTEQEMTVSDDMVIRSAYRLFSVMRQTIPSEFLGRNMMREIIYYLLCGSCGRQFLQSIANIRHADEIYAANSWIKENFRDSFTVESLAAQRNMSVSIFHQKFKRAVGMGPLQCQKRLRLTEARRLMLDEGKSVTEASVEVGYESLSQFIRDYRKMFGAAPKEDILYIQRQLKKQANFSEKQASNVNRDSATL